MKFILVTSLLFVAFCSACSTSKKSVKETSENKSHYHLQRFERSQPGDSAIVVTQGKRDSDMLTSFIIKVIRKETYDAYEFGDQTTGIILLSPGTYIFEFLEPFSSKMKTREINLSRKDSVRINFYLERAELEGYSIETGRRNRK